jgi:hypothetical protein
MDFLKMMRVTKDILIKEEMKIITKDRLSIPSSCILSEYFLLVFWCKYMRKYRVFLSL